MSEEQVEVRNTRSGNARKIDEWTVLVPGGRRVKFGVHLKYTDGQGRFFVSSDDETYKQIRAASEDINELRAMVEEAVSEFVERDRSENWRPATQVELSHKLKDHDHQGFEFSLRLRLKDVEIIPGEPRGNYGEVTTRSKYAQEIVLEREHTLDLRSLRPTGSLQDPEVKAWLRSPLRGEQSDGLARSLIEKSQADPMKLACTLEAFSALLGERVGPMRTGIEGWPEPEELIEMMREAVEKSAEIEPEKLGTGLEGMRF